MSTITAPPLPTTPSMRRVDERDYLSYTQITTFQRCPLRWYFQYEERRPLEQTSAALLFGSGIHAALELYYHALLAGCTQSSVDELLLPYDEVWQAVGPTPILFGKGETAESLHQVAQAALEAFLASPAALPAGEIIGIEEELRCVLDDELPQLLGRIDLLVRDGDALVIRDFKTSRSAWGPAKVEESLPQLWLYGQLAAPLRQALGDLPLRCEFLVITKARQPSVQLHQAPLAITHGAHHRAMIQRVWRAMQADHAYPNPSPMNCSTCPFRNACRDWRG